MTPIVATIRCLGIRPEKPALYRVGALGRVVEAEEPTRKLCRLLAYDGHAGRLEVVDADAGRLRFWFERLEEAARWRLWEDPETGMVRRRWVPHPKAAAWERELHARFRVTAATVDGRKDPTGCPPTGGGLSPVRSGREHPAGRVGSGPPLVLPVGDPEPGIRDGPASPPLEDAPTATLAP